jgi:formylglycine-generating enzyme required for sulfatase activity
LSIIKKPLDSLTEPEKVKDTLLGQFYDSKNAAPLLRKWDGTGATAKHTEAQRLAAQQAELARQVEEKQEAVAKQLAEAKHREAEAAKKREAEAKRAEEEKRRKAEEAAKQAEERQRAEQAEREAQDKQATQQTTNTQHTPIEPKPNWIKHPLVLAGGGLLALGGVVAFFTPAGSSGSGVHAGESPHVAVVTPPPATPVPVISKENTNSLGITMVTIDAGSFVMGCQSGRDKDCSSHESPTRSVSISSFELGKTEVTQGQWKAVMGSAPPELAFKNCGDTCPVERVSWNDVQEFIRKLNQQTGNQYRLPSESEWEYACRAGQSTNYCGGDNVDSVAWYGYEKSGKTTHPVGKKDANAWGLYDMSGNVWEWVQDSYHDSYKNAPPDGKAWEGVRAYARVLRGGSQDCDPQDVRAAYRNGSYAPSMRSSDIGFRLARTLP